MLLPSDAAVLAGADDDWQLVSAASSSSMTPKPQHRDHSSQRQQDSQAASPSGQHQTSPTSKAGQAQDFPELNAFSNEELVAILSDSAKYRKLVDSVMTKSHIAQVQH